jgi:hypothetical protein
VALKVSCKFREQTAGIIEHHREQEHMWLTVFQVVNTVNHMNRNSEREFC